MGMACCGGNPLRSIWQGFSRASTKYNRGQGLVVAEEERWLKRLLTRVKTVRSQGAFKKIVASMQNLSEQCCGQIADSLG